MGRRIRIVQVRDHGLYPAAVGALLGKEADFRVFDIVAPCERTADLVQAFGPQVLVTDTHTACVSCPSLLADLRHACPRVPLLLLRLADHEDEPGLAERALLASHVACSADSDQLMQLLRKLAGGASRLDADARPRLLPPRAAGQSGNGGARAASGPYDLSPREGQILALVAAGNSSRSIAERLRLSLTTVATHRANLMRKVDCHNVASLTRFALNADLSG